MSKIQNKYDVKFSEIKRISIYIYIAQLEKIEEICRKRKKTKRRIFFEAIQNYIALFEQGKV